MMSVSNNGVAGHHVFKKTNWMTICNGKTRPHDTYKCENCEVTGKRFTLGPEITPDKQYKAKKWQMCKGVPDAE